MSKKPSKLIIKMGLSFFSLLSSLSAAASEKTLKHENCYIYLPTSSRITSWEKLQQNFIDKGYTPIEFSYTKSVPGFIFSKEVLDPTKLPEKGSLLASIHYELEKGKLNSNICTVSIAIKEILSKDPFQEATKFIDRQTSRSFFGTEVTCPDKKILQKIPNCEVK